jgi:hypothetical protein
MKMKLSIVLVLLCAVTVGAQTANVIELKPEDSSRAQKAWDDLQKAEAGWKDVQDQIDMKYVEVPFDGKSGGTFTWPGDVKNGFRPKSGFNGGFEFSQDFKYIVPKPVTIVNGTYSYPIGGIISQ